MLLGETSPTCEVAGVVKNQSTEQASASSLSLSWSVRSCSSVSSECRFLHSWCNNGHERSLESSSGKPRLNFILPSSSPTCQEVAIPELVCTAFAFAVGNRLLPAVALIPTRFLLQVAPQHAPLPGFGLWKLESLCSAGKL